MSFDPSLVRRALDHLLDAYPMFDLVSVDWQAHDRLYSESIEQRVWGELAGPWVLVKLGQPSEGEVEAWAVWSFAIWKTTGALYTVGADGAVPDDPIWRPLPPRLPCDRHPEREAYAKIGLPGPPSRWACRECFAEFEGTGG